MFLKSPPGLLNYHSIYKAYVLHYNDVMMSAMASQITNAMIVYSTVYSGAEQRVQQNSASPAFVRGIHRWLLNSSHKVTWKMFPLNDVIMSSMHARRSITFAWRFIPNNYHADLSQIINTLHRNISPSASQLKKSVKLSIYVSFIILSRIISHVPVKNSLFPGTCFDICI